MRIVTLCAKKDFKNSHNHIEQKYIVQKNALQAYSKYKLVNEEHIGRKLENFGG